MSRLKSTAAGSSELSSKKKTGLFLMGTAQFYHSNFWGRDQNVNFKASCRSRGSVRVLVITP
jgi:hypothetical protein